MTTEVSTPAPIEQVAVTEAAAVTVPNAVLEAAPITEPTPSFLTATAEPVEVVEPAPEIKAIEDKPAEVTEPVKEPAKDAEVTTDAPKEEVKEIEGKPSDEPAVLPTYEEFTVPEGITLDAEQVGDINKVLGEFEVKTKADHAEVQALGQALIDRHATEMTKSINNYNTTLLDAWEKQKSDWRETFEKDPEIGGNRKDTTINAALEFIKTHGGTEDQKKEIHQLMDQTGVGNHPAILRLFAKAMDNMREGKPLPATRPVIQKSKLEKFYGATT